MNETLVPFTTGWVGSSPDAVMPEAVYALDLLLWSAAFHWLDYQIRKDNPGAERDSSTRGFDRIVIYGGLLLVARMAQDWSFSRSSRLIMSKANMSGVALDTETLT